MISHYYRISKDYLCDFQNNTVYFFEEIFYDKMKYINDNKLAFVCLRIDDNGNIKETPLNGWELRNAASFNILHIIDCVFIKFPHASDKTLYKLKFG